MQKIIDSEPAEPENVKVVADHVISIMSIVLIQRENEDERIGEPPVDNITKTEDVRKEQVNTKQTEETLQKRKEVIKGQLKVPK